MDINRASSYNITTSNQHSLPTSTKSEAPSRSRSLTKALSQLMGRSKSDADALKTKTQNLSIKEKSNSEQRQSISGSLVRKSSFARSISKGCTALKKSQSSSATLQRSTQRASIPDIPASNTTTPTLYGEKEELISDLKAEIQKAYEKGFPGSIDHFNDHIGEIEQDLKNKTRNEVIGKQDHAHAFAMQIGRSHPEYKEIENRLYKEIENKVKEQSGPDDKLLSSKVQQYMKLNKIDLASNALNEFQGKLKAESKLKENKTKLVDLMAKAYSDFKGSQINADELKAKKLEYGEKIKNLSAEEIENRLEKLLKT